jgi:hypothetical protein
MSFYWRTVAEEASIQQVEENVRLEEAVYLRTRKITLQNVINQMDEEDRSSSNSNSSRKSVRTENSKPIFFFLILK